MTSQRKPLHGSGLIGAAFLAVAQVAQGATIAPDAAHPSTFRIVPPTDDFLASASVGTKKSGTFCLPAGSILWRESRPDKADATKAIVASLVAAGLNAISADDAVDQQLTTDYTLRSRVTALRLTACVPPGGLGGLLNHSKTIKGSGTIVVEWSLHERGQSVALRSVRTCSAFTLRADRGDLSMLTMMGLKEAAIVFSRISTLGRMPPNDASAEC